MCIKYRNLQKHGYNKNNQSSLLLKMDWTEELRYKSSFGINGLKRMLNPFKPNGLFYLKSLDRSISQLVFIIIMFCRNV